MGLGLRNVLMMTASRRKGKMATDGNNRLRRVLVSSTVSQVAGTICGERDIYSF